MGLVPASHRPVAPGRAVTSRIPIWYAAVGAVARLVLGIFRSQRVGPWPRLKTESVWIHSASLGEAKSVLALLGLLPPNLRLALTLTSATREGQKRLRAAGRDAFLLPCDDHRTVADFLAARRVRRALFLEAEAWPAILEALGRSRIPTAFASFRSSIRSLRRWRRFSRLFPGWTESVELVWTDRPGTVDAVEALGVPEVRAGSSLKWSGIGFLEATGSGPDAAISIHLRDLPAIRSLSLDKRDRGWLWFPRRPWQAPLFRVWARLLGFRPVAEPTPKKGEVHVSARLGDVGRFLPGCRSAWVSPGHDIEEPFHLGVAHVSTGRRFGEVAMPDATTDFVAKEIVAWLSTATNPETPQMRSS